MRLYSGWRIRDFRTWTPDGRRPLSIPDALLAICKNLVEIYQGKNAWPPVWNCRNEWGAFTFRAYFLEQESRGGKALLGVTVEMQEPQALYLAYQLRTSPLSPWQKEVCSHYYEKMRVHSQAELFTKFGMSLADRNRLDPVLDTQDITEIPH